MSDRSDLVERITFNQYKKSFEDGSVITQYKYIHSALGAISFSFFLALFSAGSLGLHADVELQIAMTCFAVSLVGNVFLFVVHHFFGSEREYLWEIHRTKPYQVMENISWGVPVLGALALICFFSIVSFATAILTIVGFFIGAKLTKGAVRSNEEQIGKARLHAIRTDDISQLERLDILEFKERFSEGEIIFNQYEYRVQIITSGSELVGRKTVCLHHQVVVGDSIQLTASGDELLRVVAVIHAADYTTLNCVRVAEGDSQGAATSRS